jgi:uncharacterized sulfatase
MRRSTVDLMYTIGDAKYTIVKYLGVYWLPLLLFVIFCFLFFFISRKIFFSKELVVEANGYKKVVLNLIILIAAFVAARGIQKSPFVATTLFLHVPPQLQPLASNSGFSLSYSILKKQTQLPHRNYFNTEHLDNLFHLNRNYGSSDSFKKKNVIIFIIESFSTELFDSSSKHKANTPFLDSLLHKSVVCTNSYANAYESNKAVVSILGSMPSFMDEPYYYSIYASNKITGIGLLLSAEGYNTSFFMGSNEDHFGFGKWCRMLGIKNYYSMEDYPDKNHFDGHWGISDHYFLPYAAQVIKSIKEPFFATVFNLSSHFPFPIPEDVQGYITDNKKSKPQQAFNYVDYSLRLFFDVIKDEPWYSNTLFVFTGDHSFMPLAKTAGVLQHYRVPIFFHMPFSTQKIINKPVQQFDIVPTILATLNYPRSFSSFGSSVFDNTTGYIYLKHYEDYAIVDSSFFLRFSDKFNRSSEMYNYRVDPFFRNNLINQLFIKEQQQNLELRMKAFIQRYTDAYINNRIEAN